MTRNSLSRRQLLGAAAALGAVQLAACARKEPVRIGFLGGLSGRVSDIGVGGRNGAQLAVDDLNAAGGIDGRPVELVARDDEQNNEVGRQRLQDLAAAGVQFVVGPMTSSVAVAVAPRALERGLLLISPTATTHELSGKADAFFRMVPDAPRGGAEQAAFLFAQGHRTMAFVADFNNRAFSESWCQGAKQRFTELGGRVLGDLNFTSAPGVQYGQIAQALVAARAEVLLIVANTADTAVLMQHVRRADDKVQLASSPWAGTDQLLQQGGRAVEGALVAHYFDRFNQAPAFLQFAVRFRDRFGEPPGFAATNAFDATMFGAEVVRRAKQGGSLIDVARTLRSFPGLQRTLQLDEFGDASAPLALTWARAGTFEAVKAQ
jgi:branched-chain amino acid transport system substrate-binding protein